MLTRWRYMRKRIFYSIFSLFVFNVSSIPTLNVLLYSSENTAQCRLKPIHRPQLVIFWISIHYFQHCLDKIRGSSLSRFLLHLWGKTQRSLMTSIEFTEKQSKVTILITSVQIHLLWSLSMVITQPALEWRGGVDFCILQWILDQLAF